MADYQQMKLGTQDTTASQPKTGRANKAIQRGRKVPGKKKHPCSEDDSIWEEGYYAQSLDPKTLEGKMRTFHEVPGAALDHSCKKCGTAISAHNRDWHDGMCDGCFNDTYFPENKPRP